METLAALLGVAGFLGFFGGVAWLVVALIRRRSPRTPGIVCGVSLVVFLAAAFISPPSDSESKTPMDGEMRPTLASTPQATMVPDEFLISQLIKKALGSTNRDVERVRSIALNEVDRHLVIEWSINDNLTGGLRKSGAKKDVLEVLEAIRDSTVDVSRVTMRGSRSLADVYGNVSEGDVVRASYDKETIDRINFENVRTDNAWIIADQIWILPDFQD